MPSVESIDSLHASLEPLEALRGEHSQLEEWVNDSFQSLEKLHEDLSVWQSELARKQTELDLREDTLEKCQEQGANLDGEFAQWKQQLEAARKELQLLEEENGEQLEVVEDLENRCVGLQQELEVAHQRCAELEAALAEERERTSDEQSLWREEFGALRRLLEDQRAYLVERLGGSGALDQPVEIVQETLSSASSRSAELRRRAESRRAARRQNQQEGEESPES